MSYLILYRISAGLLALGCLGHTLGGMLRTSRRGPQAGPQADEVLAAMKSVHFNWRGADSTWYAFWMGNGLGVSALLLIATHQQVTLPIAWATFVSLASLAALGFKYFPARIGAVFAVIALLTGIGAALSTAAVLS